MGHRKSFKGAPKLWKRKNGRLCRCSSVDQLEYPFAKTISSLVDSVSSSSRAHPGCWKKCSVLDLPEECLVIVLKNLPLHEICNVAQVCKRFYQVSCNSTLWKSINLSSVYDFPIRYVNVDFPSESTSMTFPKRRMLFASFLSARGAALNDIHGEVNIFCEADMFRCLLNSNVRNLQTVKLQLARGMSWPSIQELQAFRDVLRCLVQKCCNTLKYLKCYVDISHTTAKILRSLHRLEYLNLQFLTPLWLPGSHERYLQPKAIDTILSLPNLKYFKISICQSTFGDLDQPEYILKSDSLEILDFGHTKDFIIKKMIFPKLHTIKAECLHNYHDQQRAVCLFDIVEEGCPQIQTLNDYTSLVPGLQNFNLSNEQKIRCYFCICPIHDPSRSYN
ncbi:hypothetical protein ACROYT_G040271 [Oculina patagonica]